MITILYNTNADALSRFPVNPIQNSDYKIPSPSYDNNSYPQHSPITLDDLGLQLPTTPNLDSNELPLIDLHENFHENLTADDTSAEITGDNLEPTPLVV